MSTKCVLARDNLGGSLLSHSEHVFVSVPRTGDSVSVLVDGRPEVFFVTSVMHCEEGLFEPASPPVVNLTIAKEQVP